MLISVLIVALCVSTWLWITTRLNLLSAYRSERYIARCEQETSNKYNQQSSDLRRIRQNVEQAFGQTVDLEDVDAIKAVIDAHRRTEISVAYFEMETACEKLRTALKIGAKYGDPTPPVGLDLHITPPDISVKYAAGESPQHDSELAGGH